ncbi:MAG: integrase core domain-containing protein, partial [Deltaproteobacteria bacterium]|nr:integrase core domain-containing protein [Deltaproteobacteria bacterium]
YPSVEKLQKALDQWLQHYNYERPHRGYRNMGKRPIETIEAGKVIKEQITTKEAA